MEQVDLWSQRMSQYMMVMPRIHPKRPKSVCDCVSSAARLALQSWYFSSSVAKKSLLWSKRDSSLRNLNRYIHRLGPKQVSKTPLRGSVIQPSRIMVFEDILRTLDWQPDIQSTSSVYSGLNCSAVIRTAALSSGQYPKEFCDVRIDLT